MKKTLFITLFALLILSFSVSAWHCSDTDESKPALINGSYGEWGDDELLGGRTWGYHDFYVGNTNGYKVPAGCTATKWFQASCNDFCNGTTLREFYCDDRSGHATETTIQYRDYTNSVQCGYEEVPEFGVIAGAIALIAGIGIIAYRRK